MIIVYSKLKQFDKAMEWLSILMIADSNRYDDEQCEFIAEKLAFKIEDMDLAKKYFIEANIKSEKQLVKKKEYLALIKS
ncbi:MAG: hypothetical protein JXA16_05705 [Bacteroidales bacterium]|nr:hypothetical protein [Bacteroidales bacterium]